MTTRIVRDWRRPKGGIARIGWDIAATPTTWVFRMQSRSQYHQSYKVEVLLEDKRRAVCDCPGFLSHHHCKHMEEIMNDLKVDPWESKSLVPLETRPPSALLPSREEISVMGMLAKSVILARGHAVPAALDSAGKAFAVMLAGWELGLKPMTALRHVFVVNGRTEPDAQVMRGIVLARDRTAEFIDSRTEDSHTVELWRGGKLRVSCTYTMQDAQRSGQASKPGPWQQYTADMLAWAATKRACRLGAPDLINEIEAGSIAVDEAEAMLPTEESPLPIEPEESVSDEAEPEPPTPEPASDSGSPAPLL